MTFTVERGGTCYQEQDTVDAAQWLSDAGVVRHVDAGRGRARKRDGHTGRRAPGAHAHRRRAGQDRVVVRRAHIGWLLPGRRASPVRRTHVPPDAGRRPDPIRLDAAAQDLPGRK